MGPAGRMVPLRGAHGDLEGGILYMDVWNRGGKPGHPREVLICCCESACRCFVEILGVGASCYPRLVMAAPRREAQGQRFARLWCCRVEAVRPLYQERGLSVSGEQRLAGWPKGVCAWFDVDR